jgi:ELWxxDGT repeat protein
LWRTDGLDPLELVADINQEGGSGIYPSFIHNGKLYFGANDGITGNEPYVSDGTPGGTQLLQDLNPSSGSFPTGFELCGSQILFGAKSVNGEHPDLFSIDIGTDAVSVVRPFNQTGYSGINEIKCWNGSAYFTAANSGYNQELWVTDGTLNGTAQIAEIHPDSLAGSYPNLYFTFGEHLYFQAADTAGNQLWTLGESTHISCDGAPVELCVSNPAGIIDWYDEENEGNWLGNGTTYTTGNLLSDTTIWASLSMGGCTGSKEPINIEIFRIDSVVYPDSLCLEELAQVVVYTSIQSSDVSYSLDGIMYSESPIFQDMPSGSYQVHAKHGDCELMSEIEIMSFGGTWYLDDDGDSFGTEDFVVEDCLQPAGYVPDPGDCDDDNSAIYPGAPGLGDGVDTDCNGIIDQSEATCLGDLNFDGIINTTDLLLFLSEFGCQGECLYDLDGDDALNTSDLLLFLSLFGTNCN